MANRLRELRIGRQIPAKDMVETVQAVFPKFDKTVLSKCENDAKYGVTISQSAMDKLYDTYDPERQTARQSRTSDRHKLPRKVSCRLTEEDYGALQRLIITDGYDSMQDCLADVISKYIQKEQS